ncbi:MAG: F0F1 ATP synthase subunit epsilon [Burkholderiales bacterium]|jgi:F-type H+-transporting ATPase subunit epsilon
MALPTSLELEIVTPEGLLLREPVDEVIAPGEEGYFGVLPGHTPMLATLGMGELKYRRGSAWQRLTCFSGWCEVLPDRVSVLADMGERASDIDVGRAEEALQRAADRMKQVRGESGYDEVHDAYTRAVTRLAVARKERGGA